MSVYNITVHSYAAGSRVSSSPVDSKKAAICLEPFSQHLQKDWCPRSPQWTPSAEWVCTCCTGHTRDAKGALDLGCLGRHLEKVAAQLRPAVQARMFWKVGLHFRMACEHDILVRWRTNPVWFEQSSEGGEWGEPWRFPLKVCWSLPHQPLFSWKYEEWTLNHPWLAYPVTHLQPSALFTLGIC